MITNTKKIPDVEIFQNLLLDMALERSVPDLLDNIVQRLVKLEHVALARIWQVMPGDNCYDCQRKNHCENQTHCLHLSASAGNPIGDRQNEWNRLDGPFSRNPLGFLKVGEIVLSKKPIQFKSLENGSNLPMVGWEAFKGEKNIGFIGQPILFKDEIIGVLALFTRAHPDTERLLWLRMVADHAAISVINARAFEEIETLKSQLEKENAYLHERLDDVPETGVMVGQGDSFQRIQDQINLAAPTNVSVLILGESGTGKELVAKEIHLKSKRSHRPLVRVNCAAIPRDLYESEFFGHKKGAFTGAHKEREGKFDIADGGTLFLDEIGEIPYDLQSKLLRVLQEGQYESIGGNTTKTVNVRIIAATNRDLKVAIQEKRFRQDLYYRLNVFPIELDPLRDRKEDIPPLAGHFLKIACKKLNRPELQLTQSHILKLISYEWPGNVRELQNVIERAVILASNDQLQFDFQEDKIEEQVSVLHEKTDDILSDDHTILKENEIKQLVKNNINSALAKCDGKIYGPNGAATMIGIKPTTLISRIKKMGISSNYPDQIEKRNHV